MSETIIWRDKLWEYRLEPAGHVWRFTGTLHKGLGAPLVSDFGTIPGGAYAEIARMVLAQTPRETRAVAPKL